MDLKSNTPSPALIVGSLLPSDQVERKSEKKRARKESQEEEDLLLNYLGTRKESFFLEVLRTDLRRRLEEHLDVKYDRKNGQEKDGLKKGSSS